MRSETGTLPATLLARVARWIREGDGVICKQQEVVDRVIRELAGAVRVCLVDKHPHTLAQIACWHTRACCYRGYRLYTDRSDKTYMIDPSCQYVASTGSRLVQVESLAQSKALVDALLTAKEYLTFVSDHEKLFSE